MASWCDEFLWSLFREENYVDVDNYLESLFLHLNETTLREWSIQQWWRMLMKPNKYIDSTYLVSYSIPIDEGGM